MHKRKVREGLNQSSPYAFISLINTLQKVFMKLKNKLIAHKIDKHKM